MNVTDLIAYHRWANVLTCSAIKLIPDEILMKDFGGSFGSIQSTMVHLLEADWIWLNRWKGVPLADFPSWDLQRPEAVIREWLEISDAMVEVARSFETDPERDVNFIMRSGKSLSLPFQALAVHVMNHGSYHRGQIANMMRGAGYQPPSTDYFIFCTTAQ